MPAEFLRRLGRLHRLLWMDERVTDIESRVSQLARLRNRIERLSDRIDDQGVLMDALKSSLEVPPELIDEFAEWKAANPIPERPLVSVIVATYNRARLLTERSIPSVLNQTYDNLELIVVGDCCTDETEEAVAEIDDPRLTFVNLPQRGVYPADPVVRWRVVGTPAWNKALALTRGDFITHLDDDDEYTLDRLEKLVKFASEEGCDLVWHPFWWETDTGEWKLQEAHKFVREQVNNVSVFYRSWFKKIPYSFDAHLLMEVIDWNRLRRIKYINPVSRRYPEPLFKYYNSKRQSRDYKRPGWLES